MTSPSANPPGLRPLPRFTRESLPLGDWQYFRKKTTTQMIRITGPFVVETREGPLVCDDGWLALDSKGSPYPIAADEQAVIYEPAEDQV